MTVHCIGSCCRAAHEGFHFAGPGEHSMGVCHGGPQGRTAVLNAGSCCRTAHEGFQFAAPREYSMGVCRGGPQGGTAVHCIPESALASLEVMGQKVPESALASLEVMLVEELREAGGMSRMVDFNIFLGGVLGALCVHFT